MSAPHRHRMCQPGSCCWCSVCGKTWGQLSADGRRVCAKSRALVHETELRLLERSLRIVERLDRIAELQTLLDDRAPL